MDKEEIEAKLKLEEIEAKLKLAVQDVLSIYGESGDFEPLSTATEYMLTMLTALQFRDGGNRYTFRVERNFSKQINLFNRVKERKIKDLKVSVKGRRCDLVVMSPDLSTNYAFIEFKIRVRSINDIHCDLCRLLDMKKTQRNNSNCRYLSVFQREIPPDDSRQTEADFEGEFQNFEKNIEEQLQYFATDNGIAVPELVPLTDKEGFVCEKVEAAPSVDDQDGYADYISAKKSARFYMISLI